MRRPLQNEAGFTLLELLLVIGVAAVLLLGISQITRSWVNSEVSDGAGQHLERIASIVQKHVQANWLDPDMQNSQTDVLAAALTPGSPWADLRAALDQEGLLTATGGLRSPLGVDLQIAYVFTTGTPDTYRATIYSVDPLPNKKVIDAARQAGAFGGSVTAFPDINTAFGAFGQWSVPKNDLTGGTFPCAADTRNGCLVAMVSYSNDTLCGSFLYRIDVETGLTCPGGNTMRTDLNMGNNNISGAQNIDTNDLTVDNTALLSATTVTGDANFNGPTNMNQGLTVVKGMNVTGDANFSGDLTMTDGTLNVTDLNASSVTSPEIATNDLTASNMVIDTNGGALTVDSDMTVNQNMTIGSTSGAVFATSISAGQIDTGTGPGAEIITGTMDVKNTMEITGNVVVKPGGTVAVDRLVADKCVKIYDSTIPGYRDFGSCI